VVKYGVLRPPRRGLAVGRTKINFCDLKMQIFLLFIFCSMASLYIFTELPLPAEYHQLIASAKCVSYRSKMSDPPPLPNTDLHVFNEPETDFFFTKAIPIMSMQKVNCIVCGTSKQIKEFAKLVAGTK
jgi:hypothetical protein